MIEMIGSPGSVIDKILKTPDKFFDQIVDISWISQLLLSFYPKNHPALGFYFGSGKILNTNIEVKWWNIFFSSAQASKPGINYKGRFSPFLNKSSYKAAIFF